MKQILSWVLGIGLLAGQGVAIAAPTEKVIFEGAVQGNHCLLSPEGSQTCQVTEKLPAPIEIELTGNQSQVLRGEKEFQAELEGVIIRVKIEVEKFSTHYRVHVVMSDNASSFPTGEIYVQAKSIKALNTIAIHGSARMSSIAQLYYAFGMVPAGT